MTNGKRIYKLTPRILRIRKSKNASNICYTCGFEIKVGRLVFTNGDTHGNSQGRSTVSKIRHEECAKRVNLI